jgi:hypothetical protein
MQGGSLASRNRGTPPQNSSFDLSLFTNCSVVSTERSNWPIWVKLRFFGKLLHDLATSLGVWKPGTYLQFLTLEGVTVAEIREKPSLGWSKNAGNDTFMIGKDRNLGWNSENPWFTGIQGYLLLYFCNSINQKKKSRYGGFEKLWTSCSLQGAEMILFLASERRKTTTNRPEMHSACARQRESAPYQAKDE